MDMVHGDMKHRCDYCEKDFNTGDSLKLHIKENHKKSIRCVHRLIHTNSGRRSLIEPDYSKIMIPQINLEVMMINTKHNQFSIKLSLTILKV